MDLKTSRPNCIASLLSAAGVPHAVVGSHAVAAWVATKKPAAACPTTAIDLLLRRSDLRKARAVAADLGLEYFEVITASMFLSRTRPDVRQANLLIWAGEKVKADDPLPNPTIGERQELEPGKSVVSLAGLLRTKLMTNRDKDRVHLRDMIDVGLIDRSMLAGLPAELATRLDALLTDAGR